ncbi:MAG TPA: hypothetical protein VMH50_10535 [Thermoleophilia bacterium]|nr:hypothetical protein [Thermoleophilia bacterium]
MTRFAWRQFRLQALIAFGILAAVVVFFTVTHPQLVDLAKLPQPDALKNRYATYEIVARLLLVVPALIGIFWGAPLLARELETGTFRLAWTQSVTRRRWLAVKLALVGGASVVVTGVLSWAVTWWSTPVDHVTLDRFSALVFSERGIVPVGYAAFAFAVGAALGLLLRRTLPAMAATLAVFVGARLAFTQWVRPHLMVPVHETLPLTSAAFNSAGITSPNGPLIVTVDNGIRPGAWILSDSGNAVDSAGKVVYGLGKKLASEDITRQNFREAIARLGLYVQVAYQPASRYWTFQWVETGIFMGLALVLTIFSLWWVRRRLS